MPGGAGLRRTEVADLEAFKTIIVEALGVQDADFQRSDEVLNDPNMSRAREAGLVGFMGV